MRNRSLLVFLFLAVAGVVALSLWKDDTGTVGGGAAAHNDAATAQDSIDGTAQDGGNATAPNDGTAALIAPAPLEVEPTDSTGRALIAEPWTLLVSSPGGQPLEATIQVLIVTPELETYLDNELDLDPARTRELAEVVAERSVNGRALFADRVPPGRHWVWAEAPGHGIEPHWLEFPLPPDQRRLVVRPVEPVTVRAVDADGAALSGMSVRFWCSSEKGSLFGRGWEERITTCYFWDEVETGADGRAVLRTLPADGVNVTAGGIGTFANAYVDAVRPGESVEVELDVACNVQGRVTDARGAPITGAQVDFHAMDPTEGWSKGLGDSHVDGQGGFESANLSPRYPAILAIAYAPGHESALHRIERPAPGEVYHHDFELRPAVAVEVVLLAGGKTPMPGFGLQFSRGGDDWVPGAYTSDERGRTHTEQNLVPGEAYLANWWTPDQVYGTAPVRIPAAAPFVVEIPLPRLARFDKVAIRIDDEPVAQARLEFLPHVEDIKFATAWTNEGPSPWFPAGPGLLWFEFENGRRASKTVALLPDRDNVFEWELETCELSFTLPPPPDEHPWVVTFDYHRDAQGGPFEFEAGAQSIALLPGRFAMTVAHQGAPWLHLGPLDIGPAGLALGQLGGEALGSVSGRVHDGQDKAWLGTTVFAYLPDGRRFGPAESSASGHYHLAGLPAGNYRVRVFPYVTKGLAYPDVEHQLRLRSGEERGSLDFELGTAQTARVQLSEQYGRTWQGFRLGAAALETVPVAGDGSFFVGAPAADDWIGAATAGAGAMRLIARTGPFSDAIELDPLGLVERSLQFLLPDGSPAAWSGLAWEIGGRVLPLRGSTDAEGHCDIRASKQVSAILRVDSPVLGIVRLPVAGLPGSGVVALAKDAFSVHLTALDLSDRPVPGVRVWSDSLESPGITDARGGFAFQAARSGAPVEAEKAGFWPLQASVGGDATLRMRRRLDVIAIEASPLLRIAHVTLTPAFDVGLPFQVPVRRTQGEDTRWTAGSLPEGLYDLAAADDSGAIVRLERIDLRQDNAGPIVLDP